MTYDIVVMMIYNISLQGNVYLVKIDIIYFYFILNSSKQSDKI